VNSAKLRAKGSKIVAYMACFIAKDFRSFENLGRLEACRDPR